MIKCPVCNKEYDTNITTCNTCKFTDRLGIQREFVSLEDMEYWRDTTIVPYRIQWEADKKQAQLEAELKELRHKAEQAQKRETALLAKLKQAEESALSAKSRPSQGGGIILKSDPKAGDIIPFGPFDWRVLEVMNKQALLLSDKVIEKRAYHDKLENITWENSDLRKYLNSEFLIKFAQADIERIDTRDIYNKNNPWFGVDGGAVTRDKVFLLSLEELCKYFGSSEKLSKRPAPSDFERKWYSERFDGWNKYTQDLLKNQGYPDKAFWIDDNHNHKRVAYDTSGNAYWWWLRSPGGYDDAAAGVDSDGGVGVYGLVGRASGGLRPALWLNLNV